MVCRLKKPPDEKPNRLRSSARPRYSDSISGNSSLIDSTPDLSEKSEKLNVVV
jgi:hypothetical protein